MQSHYYQAKKIRLFYLILIFSFIFSNIYALKTPPPPPPSNDDCAGATLIAFTTSCSYTTYNNTGSTASASVPAPGCANYVGGDVWFKVVVPSSGHLTFDSQAGGITDGGMAVYSGTCGALTLIACDDDASGNGLMPMLNLNGMTAGSTVYIRFWEYGGNTFGTFGLCVFDNPPASNSCGSATHICNLNGYHGNTSAAYSPDFPGNFCDGCSLFQGSIENNSWLSFTAGASSATLQFTVSNCTSGDGIQMGIYSGTNCNNFTLLTNPAMTAGNGGQLGQGTFNITANSLTVGNDYYVMIDGFAGDVCDYNITVINGVATGDITGSTTVCQGTTGSIYTISTSATGYVWTVPPGASITAGQNTNSITVNWGTADTGAVHCSTLAGACPGLSKDYVVNVKPGAIAPTTALVDRTIFCEEDAGNITLSTSGGSGITEKWYSGSCGGTLIGTGNNVTIPSPTTTTNYYVRWESACGNSTCQNVSVTVNPQPTSINTTVVNTVCGNANGEIHITGVTGGTGPFTYNFNNSGFGTITDFDSLNAGNYPIMVHDVNGCDFATFVSVNNNTGLPNATVTLIDETCSNSNGIISISNPIGGTPPYTYNINSGPYGNTGVFTDLSAGSYALSMKDVSGCTFNTSAIIINSPGPTNATITTTDATCTLPNGSISITNVVGGTLPLTYNFNGQGFSTNSTYNNLAGGPYTITISDNNGCHYITQAILINHPAPTSAQIATTDEKCTGHNGIVTISQVSGGSSPYQYNFNGLGYSTFNTYTGLSAGTYPIVIKDANECTYPTFVVIANSPAPSAVATTHTDEFCGNSNGTVTIGIVTGGTPPYQYSLAGSAYSTSTSITGISAGNYALIVSDFNNCHYATTVTIANHAGPTAFLFSTIDAACGALNGQITVNTVTGGTSPYQYQLNGSPFSSNNVFSGLSSGQYPIVVKDTNGCTTSSLAAINNLNGPSSIVTSQSNSTCGNANGTVTLGQVTGGTAPYTYSFNGSGFSPTTLYSGIIPGTYTVIVKDFSGCQFITSVIVNNINGPSLVAVSSNSSTCGLNNGSFTIGAVQGGTAPYQFSFNGSTFSSTIAYNGLSAGNYDITIRDNNGCLYDTTVTLDNTGNLSTMPTSILSGSDTLCEGQTTLSVIDGTLGTNATWHWYSGNCGGSSLGYGPSYTLTPNATTVVYVRAEGTCDTTSCLSKTIVFASILPVYTIPTGTLGICQNQLINFNLVAGAGYFSYNWNTGASTQDIQITQLGDYYLTAYNNLGCMVKSDTLHVIDAPPLTPIILSTGPNEFCPDDSVYLYFDDAFHSYQWSSGSTTPIILVKESDNYFATVTDIYGCKYYSDTTTIVIDPYPMAYTNYSISGFNVHFFNNSIYGTTYTWNFGDNGTSTETETSHTYTESGTFWVVLTATNNCGSDIDSIKIVINKPNGINDSGISNFAIYPNPAYEEIHINFTTNYSSKMIVNIYDGLGQIVKTKFVSNISGSNEITMNVSNLSRGIYLLVLTSDSGEIKSKIFIE